MQVRLAATVFSKHPHVVLIASGVNLADQPLTSFPRMVRRLHRGSSVESSIGLPHPATQSVTGRCLFTIQYLIPTTYHFDVDVRRLSVWIEVAPPPVLGRRGA